jgi:hypothetical protein
VSARLDRGISPDRFGPQTANRWKQETPSQTVRRAAAALNIAPCTRPWTINRVYRRETTPVWDFVDCAENNPHVLVGKDYYMISADGYLMPTKRNQSAPDLRYFNRAPNLPAR